MRNEVKWICIILNYYLSKVSLFVINNIIKNYDLCRKDYDFKSYVSMFVQKFIYISKRTWKISTFIYLWYNISYFINNRDYNKLYKFQDLGGMIKGVFKITRKYIMWKFCKIMAIPTVLHRYESGKKNGICRNMIFAFSCRL